MIIRSPVTRPLLAFGTPKPRPPHPDAHTEFRVTQRFHDEDAWWRSQNPGAPANSGPRHGALDIGVYRCGDPVVAVADGTAVRWKDQHGALAVIVQHGGGVISRYWHLDGWTIPAGNSAVRRGQQVGILGKTGLGAVCHLHFELSIGGRNVDPWPLLEQNARAEMLLPGTFRRHILNRRARTGVAASFRDGPNRTAKRLAIIPAGILLYPREVYGGEKVGTAPDAEEWLTALVYVDAGNRSDTSVPIGRHLGYLHASTWKRTADGRAVELLPHETTGVDPTKLAADVKAARKEGALGAANAASRFAAEL